MSTIQLIPFTNSLGQVLNPGDAVLYIAEGYHHAHHVRTGIYRGRFIKTDRYNREATSISITANFLVGAWVYISNPQKRVNEEALQRLTPRQAAKEIIWKADYSVKKKNVTLTSNRAYLLA